MNNDKLKMLLEEAKPFAERRIKEKKDRELALEMAKREKEKEEVNNYLDEAVKNQNDLTTRFLIEIFDRYFKEKAHAVCQLIDNPDDVSISMGISNLPNIDKIINYSDGKVQLSKSDDKYPLKLEYNGMPLVRYSLKETGHEENKIGLFDREYFKQLGFNFLASFSHRTVVDRLDFNTLEKFVKNYLDGKIENIYLDEDIFKEYQNNFKILESNKRKIKSFLTRCDKGLEITVLTIINFFVTVMKQSNIYSPNIDYKYQLHFYPTIPNNTSKDNYYSGTDSVLGKLVGQKELGLRDWIYNNTTIRKKICYVELYKNDKCHYFPLFYEDLQLILSKYHIKTEITRSHFGENGCYNDLLNLSVNSKKFVDMIAGTDKNQKNNGKK